MNNEEEKTTDNISPFLVLPDCLLRVVFSYLDSTSLYQLTKTCRHFEYFITDPIFWRYIDARRNPNTNDKVQYCSDRIHERTTHVFLKAENKTCGLVSKNFFTKINPFSNLKVLALENQRFHGSRLTMKDFPPCLEELSLKGTHVKSATYFFQHSSQNMRKLRVLILDQCQWVTCSFLMSVAKYESLEIISAIKCLSLHLSMIPYLSMARYGCSKLKIFDCRFTSIGHELLRAFYPKESFQSLYFQSLKSAEIDYNEYIFGKSDMHTESVSRTPRPGSKGICDESLFEYLNSAACDLTDNIPESILYKDPYPACTCDSNKEDESRPPPLISFDEYYMCAAPRRKSIKFVCKKHLQDVKKLSNHFKEFFLNHQQCYPDGKPQSEPESSDSESDDSCGNCCMYGMGRSMILLTPGSTPGTIQEEVLDMNAEERQRGRVVSIFISAPFRESANTNQNNANPMPSTSRNVQGESASRNLGSSRTEVKRRLSGDGDTTEPQQSKRPKRNENLEQLDDEAKTAEANQLIESAGEMQKNMNEFVKNSMEMCNKGKQERRATTSRVPDVEMKNVGPTEGAGSSVNITVTDMSGSRSNAPSTSNNRRSNRTLIAIGESSSSRSSMNIEIESNQDQPAEIQVDLVSNDVPNNGNDTAGCSQNHTNRAEEGEPSRRQVGNNASRTAIITIRNTERHPPAPFILVPFDDNKFKKKSRLRRLSLRGFRKITDRALVYIKNLKLDLIDLTYTSVTKEGIENFLAYNPNCRVIHPLYCICKPVNPF